MESDRWAHLTGATFVMAWVCVVEEEGEKEERKLAPVCIYGCVGWEGRGGE